MQNERSPWAEKDAWVPGLGTGWVRSNLRRKGRRAQSEEGGFGEAGAALGSGDQRACELLLQVPRGSSGLEKRLGNF